MDPVIKNEEVKKVRIQFGNELMEVIATVVESMDMTLETYADKLTPEKIDEIHKRILPVFASIHKRGVDDARAVFMQARAK